MMFFLRLFLGIRLFYASRRVPCRLGWFTYSTQLSDVQNVLSSLWRNAGSFSHYRYITCEKGNAIAQFSTDLQFLLKGI
jgi:hypothetical protein